MTPKEFTPDALAALERAGFSRRSFLRGAGALVVGFSLNDGAKVAAQAPTGPQPPYAAIPLTQVDSWIAINANESVIGYAGKCDFGQGFATVQHQLIAEELNVPLERVSMLICDTALCPDQGVSSGSQGSPTQFGNAALRQALATAREALVNMGATALRMPAGDLTTGEGFVFAKADPSRRMSYGALVGGKKFTLALNARAQVKNPREYTVLGTSVPRYDVPTKVTGEFQYVHHVRVPGMLHGKVVRPPAVGAKVVSINENSVRAMPGNVRVVRKNDFVGVVADNEWAATQAALSLEVTWSQPARALPDQATLYENMRRLPSRDAYIVRAADVDEKLKSAAKVLNATYVHPYQAHGSLGTSCAVADVQGNTGPNASATIWCSSQGVYPQRDCQAQLLGIPANRVRVIFVEGSGCYGLNGSDNVAYDAGLLSQAVGRPVRVQYSRRDELTGAENYGPAYVIDLKAGLDANGNIQAWDYEAWTFSKGGRPNGNAVANIPTGELAGFTLAPFAPTATPTVPNAFSNNSNAAPAYGRGIVNGVAGSTGIVASERVLVHTLESPFFTGPLRSPNRLQNTFANESFMDELAFAAGADPIEYRLRHLSDERLKECLRQVSRAYGWDTRPGPKAGNARTGLAYGRGVSCCLYEGNNGYCAMVAYVIVDQESGEIRVARIATSADSGPISNPDGIKNQMDGGALQGMGRALFEEVRWNASRLTSVDWRTYGSYKFGKWVPDMVAVPIDNKDVEQMGCGESTITLAASAIANAFWDATGVRLREVPFTPNRVLDALATRK